MASGMGLACHPKWDIISYWTTHLQGKHQHLSLLSSLLVSHFLLSTLLPFFPLEFSFSLTATALSHRSHQSIFPASATENLLCLGNSVTLSCTCWDERKCIVIAVRLDCMSHTLLQPHSKDSSSSSHLSKVSKWSRSNLEPFREW